MVKNYQNLEFLKGTNGTQLSILAVNVLVVARGLRKSSSLTNGIGPGIDKTALREYGTEARGLDLSCNHVNASILDNSGERFTKTERRRH
jgi:hypothetical protein